MGVGRREGVHDPALGARWDFGVWTGRQGLQGARFRASRGLCSVARQGGASGPFRPDLVPVRFFLIRRIPRGVKGGHHETHSHRPDHFRHRSTARGVRRNHRRDPVRALVAQDRLHPGLQGRRQRGASFGVVQVADVSQVPEIERDVLLVLGNQDHFAP